MTLRSETKGQAGACPDLTRAIPCTVRAVKGVSGPCTACLTAAAWSTTT